MDPQEADDGGDQGEGEGEGETIENNPIMNQEESQPVKGAAAQIGLNHEHNLFEQVDEILGIENKEFARLKRNSGNQ